MATHTSTILGIECNTCKEFIFSIYRHDFVTCNCGNTSVDGGQKRRDMRILWRDGGNPPVPETRFRT